MRLSRILVLGTVALMLVLSGSDAFAKMGKGSSFGSRSTRTADRPIERTVTPPPPPATVNKPVAPMAPPVAAAPPVMAAPQPAGFFQRHPFASGFMGGLVGAGIGSMLFGHSAFASMDANPGAGMIGLLFQVALIGGLIWLMIRMFRSGASAQGRVIDVPYQSGMGTPHAVPRVEKEFEPTDGDKQVFSQILNESQRAWTVGDIGALKQIATPEVVSYLADDMAADASQGVRNVVEDIQLLRGDVIESWTEGNRHFVTAALTFTAKDYTVRLDNGSLVEGNPNVPTQSTEAWTFVRVGGGRWLLSAVERQH